MKTIMLSAVALVMSTAAGFCGLLAVTAAASSAAPIPGDGLPRSWFGFTEAELDNTVHNVQYELRVLTQVEFTLARVTRAAAGTSYEYRPRGGNAIVGTRSLQLDTGCVTHTGGSALHAQTFAELGSQDGAMTIWVPKPGKKPRASYDFQSGGGGKPQILMTTRCPDRGVLSRTRQAIPAWIASPQRPLDVRSKRLVGTYARPGDGFRFEWCFVRDKKPRQGRECPRVWQ